MKTTGSLSCSEESTSGPFMSQNPDYSLMFYVFKILIDVEVSKVFSYFEVLKQNIFHIPPSAGFMSCPSNHNCFHNFVDIAVTGQIMKLLITQFSSACFNFLRLRSKTASVV
jgi:hypothetical protein